MPFWNRPRISPDFIAVPHEPSAAERAAAGRPDRVARAVAYIGSVLDRQAALEREDRNDELVDALLDVQNLLTVPVVPGRSS